MKEIKFHQTLKRLMKGKDLSSKELSKQTAIPESTLSTYLSGKKAAYSPNHLRSLSEFFKVSVDELLFGFPEIKEGAIDQYVDDIRLGKFTVILRREK